MLYSRPIGPQTLLAECDPALEPALQEVFNSFAELAATGHPLAPETTMQFGWAPLILRPDPEASPNSLCIHQPAFNTDPLTEWQADLTITLSVVRDQVNWLHTLNVEGHDIHFDGPLVATPNAVTAHRLFALREEPATARDTGWCLAPKPAPGQRVDTRTLTPLRVYELLAKRPCVLAILGLPPGFLVEFEGEQVLQISNPQDQVVFQG